MQHMENLLHDLRYGWRMPGKRPAFTIVAVLDARSESGGEIPPFSASSTRCCCAALPFPEPDRLVKIFFNNPGMGMRGVLSWLPELDDLRHRSGVCEYVTGTDAAA